MKDKEILNTDLYKSVLSCFRYGRANAVHLKELERLNNLDSRTMRKIIELIRREGVCICSDNAGYYYPETAEEVARYIKRVEATAKSTFITLRTAKAELAKMNNSEQISIDIEDEQNCDC